MKVLNLRCGVGHDFEGWFASEDDFQAQLSRQLVQCPMCGNTQIEKRLSAPRLNLGRAASAVDTPEGQLAAAGDAGQAKQAHMLQALYERMVQHVMEHTTDVGEQFADQARKMHQGELAEAPIRGRISREEAQQLREEGIDVVSLAIPRASKRRLQ